MATSHFAVASAFVLIFRHFPLFTLSAVFYILILENKTKVQY